MKNSTRGLRDWIMQRLSAVYMAIYVILMFTYLASHPHMQYATWKHAFTVFWVQVPTLIFIVLMLWHAWIGIWTIITDYIKKPAIRMFVQSLVLLALLVFFFWGVQIIWGIHIAWTF